MKEVLGIPIPGPNAAIAAISVSGLPSDKFYFNGFLPKKKGRLKKINQLATLNSTIIIYESPFRIKKTIKDIYKIFGNRKIFIAREMTKIHEESYYTDLISASDEEFDLKTKGEFVIVISKDEDKS